MEGNWQVDAECRKADPELFFPNNSAEADAAKEYCDDCIVATHCLVAALRNNEKDGVWGGLTAAERHNRRRVRERLERLRQSS